jgi:leader peptidase (prepilin peptidase)/N-methyltransferase
VLIRLYIVLFGLVVASFLGSLAYRVPRKISMLTPPSFCPSCRRRLKLHELIPVISYLLSGGRCRSCGYHIPMQFLLVEILTPALYLLVFERFGLTPLFGALVYMISLLLYLSLVDMDTGSVSYADIAAFYLGGIGMLFLSWRGLTGHGVLTSLYGFGICLGLLGASVLVLRLIGKKKTLGTGDLFLLAGAALYVDLYGIIRILLVSSLIGLAAGGTLILMHRVDRGYRFPMLPFATAGVCVEILLFYSIILV